MKQIQIPIPVIICSRQRHRPVNNLRNLNNLNNLITVKISKPSPTPPMFIPKYMVINARSLVKPDAAPALYDELCSKNIDTCFISESWLNNKVPSSLICPDGYIIMRKDRCDLRIGGGVAIICRNDWQIKSLNYRNNLVCTWCVIATANSKFFVAAIYHLPEPIYPEVELLDHLSETCEQILSSEPDAKVIIAGYI